MKKSVARKYKPYPAYKYSGVEWLGEIPEGWDMLPSKALFAHRNMKAREGEQQLTASQSYGVIPQAQFIELEGRRVVQVITGADILKHVEKNDFVISMRSFQGGIELSKYSGSISSAYVVLKPKRDVEQGYFSYLLKSTQYIQALQSTSDLIRDGQALRFQNFVQVALPLLPKDEQRTIAQYLDRQTHKIDALLATYARLLELLAEKRSALISRAVTKGLDPEAPMKDSGVEWLGEIPEGWAVLTLKYMASMKSGDFISNDDIQSEGEFPVYGGNGLRGYTDEFNCEGYFPLIGRQGALCGNVNFGSGRFWATEHAVVVRPANDIEVKWLGLLLETMNLNQYSMSSAQPGLSVEQISNLRAPKPSIKQQKEIAEHCLSETGKLDALVSKVERAVELLKEYRVALISAAVTGKIMITD